MLDAVLRHTNLTAAVLDGPLGGADLPTWTSVIFSAEDGSPVALEAAVRAIVTEAGLSGRFEDWLY